MEQPALWQLDRDWTGFEWLEADDAPGNTVIFLRRDKAGDFLLVACNFSPVHRKDYRVGLPTPGTYELVFNTDWPRFGGHDLGDKVPLTSQPIPCHKQAQSMQIDLPPMSCVIYRLIPDQEIAR